MIRLSNQSDKATQVVYLDKSVVKHSQEAYPIEPQIVFQDREVIKEIHVPVEVEKLVEVPVIADLSQVHEKLKNHQTSLQGLYNWNSQVMAELEMQRRALVAIKAQRDIDRSRRLMLLKRIKKERDSHKKNQSIMKLVVGASILISIVSLMIKL